ncbi:hypothetical protein [Pyrinomonas methylaliphatogenes]|jgi:hypothetical protein|uniref:SWIM-type domain-containing protein n=1 Tax=Pyrinomonas methylaliphatogenes TaxID=454194 RepID=A0A0B6WUX3_9BACT|nr:hypothetical protein [Pyrinomonas methylaliphatogenes]CDM64881.1 hypothetical protein PYK22_00876 [Pyrinomonas methylaliphatogenes]
MSCDLASSKRACKRGKNVEGERLTPAEKRAARAARIVVYEAEPYGWIALSESDPSRAYHLFCDPHTRHLVCTCADFVFRGNAEPGFECKHVAATLKFIARCYLAREYDPQRQLKRAA